MKLFRSMAAAAAMTAVFCMQPMLHCAAISETDLVVVRVNEARAENGLEPVYALPVLNEAAEFRSKELTELLSHTRPDGSSCETVLNEFGIGWLAAAENIAAGQASADGVVGSWMGSTFHSANILNPAYTCIGVGCVEYNGEFYWTQIFIDGEVPEDAYLPEYTVLLGDVTGDGAVGADDAAEVLIAAASIGAGADSGLTKEMEQAADVNADGEVDASDAAVILQYAAAAGAGETGITIEQFI